MTARLPYRNGTWLAAATLACMAACGDNGPRAASRDPQRDSGTEPFDDDRVDGGAEGSDGDEMDGGADADLPDAELPDAELPDAELPDAGADAGPDGEPDAGAPPELCGANQHVLDHACTPCAAGTTNEAGDDPLAADTACDKTLCAEGYRVEAHTCVACPPGFESPLADDASGPDTFCSCPIGWSRPDAACAYCMPPGGTPPSAEACEAENPRPLIVLNDEYRDEFTFTWPPEPIALPLQITGSTSAVSNDYNLFALRVQVSDASDALLDVSDLSAGVAEYCANSAYLSPRDVLLVCNFHVLNHLISMLRFLPPTSQENRSATYTLTASDNGFLGVGAQSHTLKLQVTWAQAPN